MILIQIWDLFDIIIAAIKAKREIKRLTYFVTSNL